MIELLNSNKKGRYPLANIVIQLTNSEIEKIKTYYKNHILDRVPPGAIFTAKYNGCTITAYRSGKVMFQGSGNDVEANKWGNVVATGKNKSGAAMKKRKTSGQPLPENIASMSVLGSDEVGKGDYFGPMTVVATYVTSEQIPLLQELGVKDSKNLSDPQIVKIAKDLLTFLPYSLLTLDNEKYNRLQASGMTQGKMTAILHNQALNHVLDKIAPEKPEAILVDQFAESSIYFRHLQGQERICRENIYFSTQAEGIHLSVASASILARYAFIKAFDELSEKAGFTIPKGAGPRVDQAAARLIKAKGVDVLNQYTKLHFANTTKAKKIVRIV